MKKNDFNEQSDIIVFSFVKDSQIKEVCNDVDAYEYVKGVLSKLIEDHGGGYQKIGIGGYVQDVAGYISIIIQSYHHHRLVTNLSISEYDTSEFDPELGPNTIEEDLDHDDSEEG